MNKQALIGLALVLVFGAAVSSGAQTTIRVGAFPDITHAQAMVGKANGWFDKAMGPQVKVQWTSFNAGPAAIEALFGGAIDMTYVGPNPAINGYVRSNGEAVRVIAGAASGGASLIVRNDSGIQKPQDFHGKRVASPQFGNTQDVALRNWLKSNGLNSNDKGGDVQIIPMANPDQLTLFLKKDLDAAWTPEPWATRLIHEGNGRLFVDERTLWPNGQFVIGFLVVNTKFLKSHPDLVKNWIRANVELTDWINAHPAEAKKLLNQQIRAETGKALPQAVLDEAFTRMEVTYDPLHSAMMTAAKQAFDDGLSRPADARSFQALRFGAAQSGARGKRKEVHSMSTNAHNFPAQLPIPVDPLSPVRIGGARAKSGQVLRPIRGVSHDVPKVGLTDICLSYRTQGGERLLALDHINLQVKAGEFLCLVGPSGCGKSTLLHLIAGLHQQTSGQVLIDGKPVQGPGTDRILIFQELGLFPWLTGGENVEFGMKMKGIARAEREEQARYYLRLVHLSQFKDSYTHQLSGGMRQRVALARALATEPDVLLMDEPFAALDAQTRDLLHDELERIWAETGRTIIFVTHNVREAIRLGDRVALLTFRPGRVKREFSIDLPRPRVLEDLHVAHAAREILGELREEINRSLEVEYSVGVKPHVEPGVEQQV